MPADARREAPDEEPWLLCAPRGRRLCYAVVTAGVQWGIPWHAWERQPPAETAAEIAGAVDQLRAGDGLTTDDRRLLTALVESVDAAMYWQEPHEEDRGLAGAMARAALRPVAVALGDALPARWRGPVALDRQREVTSIDPSPSPRAAPPSAADALEAWHRQTVEDEVRAQRERPADVRARWSGVWWSTPSAGGALPAKTSRSLDRLGAAGLVLVEDSPGWTVADCLPVESTRPPRVHEVDGPGAWVDLVTGYPLEVTHSRRHDWWRTTGVEGSWLIPDWQAVGRDYDAVHVSVVGYLATAGLPLPVDGGWTLLAGWEPDATYWLTDCLRPAGEAERWVHADRSDLLGWRRIPR